MRSWTIVSALLLVSCGAEQTLQEAELLPLTLGSSWTYETRDPDGSNASRKTTTVVHRDETSAILQTVRGSITSKVWLAIEDGLVLRVREETYDHGVAVERRTFDPGTIRTPASAKGLRVGGTLRVGYMERYLASDQEVVLREDPRDSRLVVEALDEAVRTQAGEFRAIRLRKVDEDGLGDKLTWYAPGVGKVKEQGGKIEVLTGFELK